MVPILAVRSTVLSMTLTRYVSLNRPLTSAEREVLFDEGTFGTIFRDRRVTTQGQSTSFLDKREVTAATGVTSFLDKRVSMGSGVTSFLDKRLLNTVESLSLFSDIRQCLTNLNIVYFDDTRLVQNQQLTLFKDKRNVDLLHLYSFLDMRGVHHGRGVVFSDVRLTNRNLKFRSYKDIRYVIGGVASTVIIERVNI